MTELTRLASNLGPQKSFPIPEGILNHRGSNTLALSLWVLDNQGTSMEGLDLNSDAVVLTGMEAVAQMSQLRWLKRPGVY